MTPARNLLVALAAGGLLALSVLPVPAAEIDCAAIRAVYARLIKTPAYRVVSTHRAVNKVWEDVYIDNTRYSRRDGPWEKHELDPAERAKRVAAPQFSECRDDGEQTEGGVSMHAYSLLARLPQARNGPGMQVRIWLDAPEGRILRFESQLLRLDYSYDNIKPPM